MALSKKTYQDRDLINGCIRNDRVSQERLYRKYFHKMMGVCLRYTNNQDQALEILNIGFLKVFQKIEKFQFKGSFEGWIRKIVFHSVSDYFRKEAKYGEMIIFEERDNAIKEQVLNRLYVDDLMKMVRSLPPATSKVFELYAIEGFNHREIGEHLGISEGTSKWHLAEARKKLKTMLKYYEQTEWQGYQEN